jgi:endoglucanase Acf2
MLKKTALIIACLFGAQGFVFGVPSIPGEGSIASSLPQDSSPQSVTRRITKKTPPFPTNKWFGSVIYNQHNSHSLRMYTYPAVIKASLYGDGLVIGHPDVTVDAKNIYYGHTDQLANNIVLVGAAKQTGQYGTVANKLIAAKTYLDDYSDWSATALWQDNADASFWMKGTFGKGFVFTYFEFSQNAAPMLLFPYDWNTTADPKWSYTPKTDDNGKYVGLIITLTYANGKEKYVGVYGQEGTTVTVPQDGYSVHGVCALALNMPNPDARFISVAVLSKPDDYDDFRPYAYSFITKTEAVRSVNIRNATVQTTFNFTVDTKCDKEKIENNEIKSNPLFLTFPHHRNGVSISAGDSLSVTFPSIRGDLEVTSGTSFSVVQKFHGILPNLTYELEGADKSRLGNYITNDKNFQFVATLGYYDTYHSGKQLAKAANLIPIMSQHGDITARDAVIKKLKDELSQWYRAGSGKSAKYFGWDEVWGGLIGVIAAPNYGLNNYNDHHFHYGYFVYASAILAMYDSAWASDYKGMVEMLIKDYANLNRTDADFTYMRNFDVYEGHSWAQGFIHKDDRGIDQESSSEAMNAWSAIYLWGLITDNTTLRDLGIWGYVTEYSAIREYYFKIRTDNQVFPKDYKPMSTGVLYAGVTAYDILFADVYGKPPYELVNKAGRVARAIKGIQVLPATPAMLYLGYDKAYAKDFFEYDAGSEYAPHWWTIWARFEALFNPEGAINSFNNNEKIYNENTDLDEGSSKTFSYHFINFFKKLGAPNTEYYADNAAFSAFKNESTGDTTVIAYNHSGAYKRVNFYKRPAGSLQGSLQGTLDIPPQSFIKTVDFKNFTVVPQLYAGTTYAQDGWSVTILNSASQGGKIELRGVSSLPAPFNEGFSPLGQQVELVKNAAYAIPKNTQLGFDFLNTVLPAGTNEKNIVVMYYAGGGTAGAVSGAAENAPLETSAPALAASNSNNGWIEVPTIVDAKGKVATAAAANAGIYALVLTPGTGEGEQFRVYPNPYKPGSGGKYDALQGGIEFDGISEGARIKIYTIMGELVFETTSRNVNKYVWNAKNSAGKNVASGIYIYHVTTGGKTRKGKLAIER